MREAVREGAARDIADAVEECRAKAANEDAKKDRKANGFPKTDECEWEITDMTNVNVLKELCLWRVINEEVSASRHRFGEFLYSASNRFKSKM